MIEKERGWWN